MELLFFVIFGLVIGAIAKFLTPGREPGGFVITALIGMAGSLIGGLIGRATGMYSPGQTTGGWIMSIIGAVVLLAIYHFATGRRGVTA